MDKRGLGRGLSALISENNEGVQGGEVRQIPVDQIVPNPYQPRTFFDPIQLEELANSILEHGILQPILVKQVALERFELVAGERRFRAAQKAGLRTVPALVKDFTPQEQLEIAIVENVQREDINAIEAARAYKRLLDEFQMSQESIAKRVGKSRSAIANILRLLALPEQVQESLEQNEITAGHARALLIVEDDHVLIHAWQQLLKKMLNVRELEALAKELNEKSKQAKLPKPENNLSNSPKTQTESKTDPNIRDLVEKIQESLGTKVVLKQNTDGSGKIEIDFYGEEDLERLIEIFVAKKERA